MFCQSEAAYEEVRHRQEELRKQAASAQMLARVRREAAQAGRVRPGRRNWLARRFRADLARP
jgi:hypothetical protein